MEVNREIKPRVDMVFIRLNWLLIIEKFMNNKTTTVRIKNIILYHKLDTDPNEDYHLIRTMYVHV